MGASVTNSIAEKATHVRAARAAGHDGKHTCHWPGCDKRVAPALWGCLKHWRMLPLAIQRRIWRAYRPGQENTKTPSREYIEAAREAQEYIAARNHERLL